LEFLHVGWHDNSENWEIILGDTHEFSESLLDTIGNTGEREEHLTLVGLGSLSEGAGESGVLIGGISEENGSVLLVTEDGLDLVLRELEDGWDHEWLDEAHEGILVSSTGVGVDGLLEFSEEDDLVTTGESVLLLAGEVGVNELDLVLGVGVWDMGLLVEGVVL
jgi:hypothetical protein